MNIKKLSLFLLIITHSLIFANNTALELDFSPNKRIEAVIGENELNRIFVQNFELTSVVGDESKYSLYWSNDYRHIFIRPKIAAGEIIELSLVSAGGIAQDVRFTVGDVTAQTIFINAKVQDREKLENRELKREIAALMRAMIECEIGKYYVISNMRELKKTKDILIVQEKTYRYKGFVGAVVRATNLSKIELEITEQDLMFKSIIAINIGNRLIAPKSSQLIFVVTRVDDAS